MGTGRQNVPPQDASSKTRNDVSSIFSSSSLSSSWFHSYGSQEFMPLRKNLLPSAHPRKVELSPMSVAIVTVCTTFIPNLSSGSPWFQNTNPVIQKLPKNDQNTIWLPSIFPPRNGGQYNSIHYQPKQCTIEGQILQNFRRCAWFDPPNSCNLMTRQKYTMFHTQKYNLMYNNP